MAPLSELVELAQSAIYLALVLSLPLLVASALVGGLVGALQTAFQVQDPSLGHLPRLLAVGATLLLLGSWMGEQVTAFAQQALALQLQ